MLLFGTYYSEEEILELNTASLEKRVELLASKVEGIAADRDRLQAELYTTTEFLGEAIVRGNRWKALADKMWKAIDALTNTDVEDVGYSVKEIIVDYEELEES